MRRGAAIKSASCAILLVALLTGCARTPRPVLDSREALGTFVDVTAYGEDEKAVRAAVGDAYAAMTEVEGALDAHDPASPIATLNADPYAGHPLPPEATRVLNTVDELAVTESFSPTLWSVVGLYDFEGEQTVPTAGDLELALAAANGFLRRDDTGSFARVKTPDSRLEPGRELAPGLDFGGAAKGLALDYGREILGTTSAIDAALITAGSTTVTLGNKPDGEPWRIGIEDPRDTETVIATVETTGAIAVSTSGDYQRFFEVDGERYHHILDPADGQPARGLRSLTVVGTHSGLESDILSTALFVMGPEKAIAYAEEHGLGLYLVDDEGRTHIVSGPEGRSWEIVPAG